jgi:hypothetical protein
MSIMVSRCYSIPAPFAPTVFLSMVYCKLNKFSSISSWFSVGDESVNRFVVKAPHADYFSNLLTYFRKQCIDLNGLVSETLK